MQPLKKATFGPFKMGYDPRLSEDQARHILETLKMPPDDNPAGLYGRRKVNLIKLNGFRTIVIKHYARGGLVHFFLKDRYIKWGKTRAEKELEWLFRVRDLGITAPRPMAFVWRGGVSYKCWLVMLAVKQNQTLAEFSQQKPEQIALVLGPLVKQVSLLIENKIHHVDLHPGNVLVNENLETFIIDFDKARFFKNSVTILRDRYISRWDRAVKKHHLPHGLSQYFTDLLRTQITER